MILPRYYINERTLVLILIAIKPLNYDLRKIIITKLVEDIAEYEFMREYPSHTSLYKQIQNDLKSLYIEYKRLNKQVKKTKKDIYRLDILITKISLLESKFIFQLKQRAGIE